MGGRTLAASAVLGVALAPRWEGPPTLPATVLVAQGVPARPWRAATIPLLPVVSGWAGSPASRALVGALERAAARWNAAPCRAPRFDVRPIAPPGTVRQIGDPVPVALVDTWGRTPGQLAGQWATTAARGESRAAPTLVGALLEINAGTAHWEFSGEGTETTASGRLNAGHPRRAVTTTLDAVITHELGHVLGLAHVCRLAESRGQASGSDLPVCDEGSTRPVLHPLAPPDGADPRVALQRLDLDALCGLYPP